MNQTTKNILIFGGATLLVAGGFIFYMQGQRIEGKNVLGNVKSRTPNRRQPTTQEINDFIQKATYSNTAYKNGIPNQPSEEERKNLIAVAQNVYFPLVYGLGIAPNISSGYRSFALNKVVGGSDTSQHMKGEAIDIKLNPNGHDNNDIWRFIKNYLDFDQMILEFGSNGNPSWIHVSFKRNGQNRKKINIAQKVDGKTKYLAFSEQLVDKIYGLAA